MLVFWKQRLAILATPKTGSTAIEAALESVADVAIRRPPALKHMDVARFQRHFAPYLAEASGAGFTVVALMREPRAWLGSWYRNRQRDEMHETAESTQGLSFDDFVAAWCAKPRPAFADIGSQAEFLLPAQGPRADRIFRYEAIDHFITFLEDRLDFQITLPQLNVSPKAPMELSERTESLLALAAEQDFALYRSLDGAA